MNRYRTYLAFLAFASAACLLSGCGGASVQPVSKQTGKVTFTVIWPASSAPTVSRVIPAATQSVSITVTQGATVVAKQLIPRPAQAAQTTATINDLPLGTVALSIQAFPNPDGTGVVLAQAVVPVTIQANQTTPITVTLNSTIATISISAPSSLPAGQTAALVATPKDATGNVVPVPPGNLIWSSSAPSVASIDPATGVVTGVSAGTTQISVKESDSGKTATVPLTVTLVVAVSPNTTTVTLSQSQPFTATITGSPNAAVTWSVKEPNGGTIDQNGNYTAPKQPGTYHVIATSQADPTQSGTATVTITSGSAVVIAQ